MYIKLLISVVVLTAISPVLIQAGTEEGSFTGLTGIYVRVEVKELNTVGVHGELSEKSVKTEAVKRLRKARIPILSEKKWESTPGMPLINICISVAKFSQGYLYSVEVSLKQKVIMDRNMAISSTAATWSVNTLGLDPDVGRVVQETGALVEEFVAIYGQMNTP